MLFEKSRILDDSSPRRAYQSSKEGTLDSTVVKSLHYGQRKLFLSEVELLTALIEARSDKHASDNPKALLIVYAGAANGQHLPFLFHLFKDVRYVLIDPAPFCAEVQRLAEDPDGPIVEIVNDYCTDEVCLRIARCYGDDYALVLVSDIRSGVPKKMTTNAEHTELIMRDNAWQRGFFIALNAECAMLKFHPPYPAVADTSASNYDPADKTPESIEYMEGTQLLGVWAPKSSSEVRLVVGASLNSNGGVSNSRDSRASPPTKTYSCKVHEEQCYHYNTDSRYQKDCAAERVILERYLKLFPGTYADASTFSCDISNQLRHPLFTPLREGFTEDHARWVHLLSSVRTPGALNYYEPLKDIMTAGAVRKLVAAYSDAECVPEGVVLDCVSLDAGFWQCFMRGDFAEAYSLPRVRWQPLQRRRGDNTDRAHQCPPGSKGRPHKRRAYEHKGQ